ncbi:pyridoxal phosphate-dependent aminotransferase [Bacillus sp. 03113]|uniref:pyridoxal phosphate-dependent aminotransferase n=1 Tax=Bacillus sp. 03113 TaxID=2578211 RepID=UPI001142BFB0|nr:aminotransferase class I/II-fold pyridoxal phosphate-dependent enzyme [Bacillus sp. 03113]
MKSMSIRKNIPGSGIRQVMEAALKVPDAIHLEVGEPAFDTPFFIKEAAKAAINQNYTHYTPNAGLISLRESIAKHIEKQYKVPVVPEQVVVTPGAINAICLSLLTLVDIGEEVLIPDPGWPNYEQVVLGQGAVPVRYRLNPDEGFSPDFKDLEKNVSDKTKVIIINSPGNPTGAVFSKETIISLVEFAKKHDLYIVSDEIYDGITFEKEHISTLPFDEDGRVIGIFGFSKNYAMTGWRIGYAVAPINIATAMIPNIELLVSCTSAISQKAAEAALNDPRSPEFVQEMTNTYKTRFEKAYQILIEENMKVYKSEGAFYLLVNLEDTGLKGMELALAILKEEHVAVAPGSTFGPSAESMIRISFAGSDEDIVEGVKRICHFAKKHSNKVTV